MHPELLEMSKQGEQILNNIMGSEYELYNIEIIITAPDLPEQPCHSDAGKHAKIGDVVTLLLLTDNLVADEITVINKGTHLLPHEKRKFPCELSNPIQARLGINPN
jgi:hypothetical protein